ncbi:MAG: hypothetical protein M3P04_12755, partial [Actinomycetota bacterium]|nr:hypothetical protein [Actinomycetota bacterium]
SGESCLFLVAAAPACPTNRGEALDATTTTHADQHAALFIPDGEGGVRLLVGNDGGVYTQSTTASPTDDFENAKWGNGSSKGLTNLEPYNVARAKDGTIWMGLQDNGTAKITDVYSKGKLLHRARIIATLGGDGIFVGVDPNNSKRAYGETPGGSMYGTVDGGRGWAGMAPPITGPLFVTPFSVDATDADHVMVGGNEIVESGSGPSTGSDDWVQVFDLGTQHHPGDKNADQTADDGNNIQTAIKVIGSNAYAGYCGVCNVSLSDRRPFRSGIATNVGGSKPGKRYSSDGWHIAKAIGLPERYVTGITFDPASPKVLYVSVGGYERPALPPGSVGGKPDKGGNLYKSVDGGEHFFDISGDLPKAPVTWVAQRGTDLVVATNFGVYASTPAARCAAPSTRKCSFQVLGKGLPSVPVASMELAPWDCNLLTIATQSRGAWTYRFGPPQKCGSSTVGKKLHPKAFANKLLGLYDFEASQQGWAGTSTDGDGVEAWRRSAPGHSGTFSMQVVPYTDEQSATLTSPRMVLPNDSNLKLSWWKMQHTEGCCDPLAVDWSSDGHVWHNVSVNAVDLTEDPTAAGFNQSSVKFVAPKGQLFIRFRMTSDALVSAPAYLGVFLDDVEIRR